MKVVLHKGDLPAGMEFPNGVAIDTEAMGLKIGRDRLCLVQLCGGDDVCHLVQIAPVPRAAPHLVRLLEDRTVLKIFHFARFDVALLEKTFPCTVRPFYCTKLASKLVRTYTDRHGLKELCKSLLQVDLSKEEQTSDWGSETLSPEQQRYAATDVLHLHALKKRLDAMMLREEKVELLQASFRGLAEILLLEQAGFEAESLFRH
ncbi:MAG: ribonuclease H-like domain-containing protein [Holosporales bacterium]|jgi:ribonuclease D|nr:ribonuclease H-like domain-containing protein [Holosporales bacterium]